MKKLILAILISLLPKIAFGLDIPVESYTAWKSTVQALGLSIRCAAIGSTKFLVGIDANSIDWETSLDLVNGDANDINDFNAIFLSSCNKPSGDPTQPFAIGTTLFAGNSSSGTVTKGTSQAIDFYLDSTTYPNGAYSNGFILISGNAIVGDYFKLQAIDVSGALTGHAGAVLGTPVIRWMVNPNAAIDVSTVYAKLFPPGVTLRLTYYSTAGILGSDVTVGMNYRLHKP